MEVKYDLKALKHYLKKIAQSKVSLKIFYKVNWNGI